MRRTSLMTLVILILLAAAVPGFGSRRPSPAYMKVAAVANATDLSQDEKIDQLKALAADDDTQMGALYQLYRLAPDQAVQTAVDFFRDKNATRESKLRMGHFLLTNNRHAHKDFPKGFTKEFADALVAMVLDGGEAEFCRRLPTHPLTAVGEYAYLASGFDGYYHVDFTPFKDPRVVPVLIRCLDAPDNVYPEDQGDCIRGRPGDATGRNTARQQIPVALAKLGDARAVKPLEKVLLKHADVYGRVNAAYALAILVKKPEKRAAIGKKLLADPNLVWCRFPFGKGLIEMGDASGVEFLSIKNAGRSKRSDEATAVLYMLNLRTNVLQKFKSPKVEPFAREVLAYEPFRAMVLFEPGSVKAPRYSHLQNESDEHALERLSPRIIEIYGRVLRSIEINHLTGLSGDLETIAKETRSEKVREMTRRCLKILAD